MTAAFGIDFGTTNTRVAYFDGDHVRLVNFLTDGQRTPQLPTTVAYQAGQPAVFGREAERRNTGRPPVPMKWLLDREEDVDIGGIKRTPEQIVADFLKHLKQQVETEIPGTSFTTVSVTIPVRYSFRARRRLMNAFSAAGIQVNHVYFEPVAAIYAGLVGEPLEGTVAAFDWGGGSLDIATVEVRHGMMHVRQFDGLNRGGSDYDRGLARKILQDFLSKQSSTSNLNSDEILNHWSEGQDLLMKCREAKESFSKPDVQEELLRFINFLGMGAMIMPLQRSTLEELLQPDALNAAAKLAALLKQNDVTPRTLARLSLSGGTCNLPALKSPLSRTYGHVMKSTLQLPTSLIRPKFAHGLNDIGNATAIGAALLAGSGVQPVLASSVGIRLAGKPHGQRFLPLYSAGEVIHVGQYRQHSFLITDASQGVARILIAEQSDPVLDPGGRLLRAQMVGVEPNDRWLRLRTRIDQHLTLNVEAIGSCNLRPDAASWNAETIQIPEIKWAFKLPRVTK